MGETRARVDALIAKLGDVSDEVRLEAIEELSTIDKEHALPALHWAIQNEMDETVRNVARDAYHQIVERRWSIAQQVEEADRLRPALRWRAFLKLTYGPIGSLDSLHSE